MMGWSGASKWGQRGWGAFGLGVLICWGAGQNIATIAFATVMFLFIGIMYYKNVSFVIMKRLLRESNVVMILVFGLCKWSIDIARPATPFSPVTGLIYLLGVSAVVFLDAVKVKSRMFVITIGIMFVLINVFGIYQRIFTDLDQGIVLLDYSIQQNKYTFMTRSTQRSIYIQIMLFSNLRHRAYLSRDGNRVKGSGR